MRKNSIVRFGLLARLFQNLRLLLSLMRDFLKGRYRDVSVKSIVIFVLTLAYIISPIDLIPDYIIGLGQIDDAVILGLSLYFLEKDLMKYEEWRDQNGWLEAVFHEVDICREAGHPPCCSLSICLLMSAHLQVPLTLIY